jgi:predicted transcriptional regulator of viral defense system
MHVPSSPRPDRDRLYETASAHAGHFTTRQAAEAGYSSQLLHKLIKSGRIVRVRQGIYRLVHFPATEHEDLAVVWLWTDRIGVFSHATALALHGLSDALPRRVHVTLPASWRARRLRTPEGVELHHADVTPHERTWIGPVPVTSVARTLDDCAREPVAPDLLRQATQQALRRGLVVEAELRDVARALAPFGGLGQ